MLPPSLFDMKESSAKDSCDPIHSQFKRLRLHDMASGSSIPEEEDGEEDQESKEVASELEQKKQLSKPCQSDKSDKSFHVRQANRRRLCSMALDLSLEPLSLKRARTTASIASSLPTNSLANLAAVPGSGPTASGLGPTAMLSLPLLGPMPHTLLEVPELHRAITDHSQTLSRLSQQQQEELLAVVQQMHARYEMQGQSAMERRIECAVQDAVTQSKQSRLKSYGLSYIS